MANAVSGVTLTKFVSQDGTVKQFKTMDADANSASQVSIMENGTENVYSKIKVKNSEGKEEYKYILLGKGKKVEPETDKKDYDKLPTFMSFGETKWDRGIDAATDGILGIDNSKPTTDGKDDGKISGWDKFKHFCKGAFAPVKNIIKHPFKTLGTGLLIGAALKGLATIGLGAVTAVAGPVMLGVGLVAGIGTFVYGAVKANKAKTDGDAKAAWENMGTGTITTVLSAIGLRKMYKASHAKAEAFANDPKYQTPNAPSNKKQFGGLAGKIESVKDKFTLKPHKDLMTALKDNKMEGVCDAAKWRVKQAGFGTDLSQIDMAKVTQLNADARQFILDGSHYKAKTAIDTMKLALGNNKISCQDATKVQQWIDDLSALSKTTKILHKAPGWKTANVIGANIANATDDSARTYSKFLEDAYTVGTAS